MEQHNTLTAHVYVCPALTTCVGWRDKHIALHLLQWDIGYLACLQRCVLKAYFMAADPWQNHSTVTTMFQTVWSIICTVTWHWLLEVVRCLMATTSIW